MSENLSIVDKNIGLLKNQLEQITDYTEEGETRFAVVPETSTGPNQTYFSLTNLMGVRLLNVTCERIEDTQTFAMSWPSNIETISWAATT